MRRNDRAALKQAMEIAQRDPLRAEQLQAKLKDEPWEEVAEFAAFSVQIDSLDLLPWQAPPAIVSEDDDDPIQADAVKLLRRMLAAGVSRYHPDQLAALAGPKRRSSR